MPRYDFNDPADRAAYLMTLPSRKIRAATLERWRKESPAMAADVQRIVLESWERKRSIDG